MTEHNWADNYTYQAVAVRHPETVAEVQTLVQNTSHVRALGSRHSFNPIADTAGDLIALDRLPADIHIDHEQRTATVSGGVRYGDVCKTIHEAGYALPNLASLPHISIAGASATATHGSGEGNQCMAAALSAVELVIGDGSLVTFSRAQHPEIFPGVVVSLGALGIVTRLTLDLQPTFEVQQYVYENLPFEQMIAHFDEIVAMAYSVSFFTDWRHHNVNQVWLKHKVVNGQRRESEASLFGATPAPADRHPIPGISAVNCTPQMGVPGPWYERLQHFRMDFMPSSGDEIQSEYLIPRAHAGAALQAVNALRDTISPLLHTSEIRQIAADDLWLSPFYRQDCIAIHFTWQKKPDDLQIVLPQIESALAPFDARPHWGKVFTMSAKRVQSLYPRLTDFRRLLDSYDPGRKFGNSFLATYLY